MVVSASAAELPTGVYYGSVNLTATGAQGLSIPVTLTVGTPTNTTLTLSQTTISFTAEAGSASPTPATVTVGSNQSGVLRHHLGIHQRRLPLASGISDNCDRANHSDGEC